jgi:hypothetical protein
MTAAVMAPDVQEADDFNVRELIRQVVQSSGLHDPAEIAIAVDRQVDDADLRVAFRSVLRSEVIEVLGSQRRHATDSRPSTATRAAQVRDWYVSTLNVSLHVGEFNGLPVWKPLGECTVAELDFVVSQRRELARRNVAQAALYERVQARMKAKKAKHVKDLGQEDLSEAMAS